ncbi:tyrosine-type recombinase/integrase [Clostridium perfringens]
MNLNQSIKEIKGYSCSGYEIYINNDKVQDIFIKGFVKKYNDKTYFLILNTQGKLIEDAFNYINGNEYNALGESSIKMRELAYTSLKILYSFMEINHIYDIKEIYSIPFSQLSRFLSGGNTEGNYIDFKLTSIRRNNTVNKYLSIYRNFFEYLELDNSYFKGKITTVSYKSNDAGFFSHAIKKSYEKYGNNKKVEKHKTVPKYIRFNEYKLIIALFKEEQNMALEQSDDKAYVASLREELIVHLMYIYGMRIGEVLGLTLEDISKNDNDDFAIITLRNRHTDKHYQRAKGCMSIISKNDYQTPSYNENALGKAFGCETIYIFEETYELIQNYLKKSRSISYLTPKCKKNLQSKNIAAKVTKSNIKVNRYIFISSYGTPIDKKVHDNYLKNKIFSKLDIPIDKFNRKNNLNHRFRHGFAMYKKDHEKYDIFQLKDALRHTSTSSCLIYLNPTEEEMAKRAKQGNKFLNESGVKL